MNIITSKYGTDYEPLSTRGTIVDNNLSISRETIFANPSFQKERRGGGYPTDNSFIQLLLSLRQRAEVLKKIHMLSRAHQRTRLHATLTETRIGSSSADKWLVKPFTSARRSERSRLHCSQKRTEDTGTELE